MEINKRWMNCVTNGHLNQRRLTPTWEENKKPLKVKHATWKSTFSIESRNQFVKETITWVETGNKGNGNSRYVGKGKNHVKTLRGTKRTVRRKMEPNQKEWTGEVEVGYPQGKRLVPESTERKLNSDKCTYQVSEHIYIKPIRVICLSCDPTGLAWIENVRHG